MTIGVVGKYVGLPDAYKSLNEALVHGGMANRVKVNIRWIDAELFEHDDAEIAARLEPMHAHPRARRVRRTRGGGQDRGGPLRARTQGAVLRHLPRHADGLHRRRAQPGGDRRRLVDRIRPDASEPVVGIITEWMSPEGLQTRAAGGDLGGTMRLGAYEAGSRATAMSRRSMAQPRSPNATATATKSTPPIASALEAGGLVFSGMSPDGLLPEIVERPDHPWFVGVQFHPELKSKPFDPHPLFAGFIDAALRQARLV